jgi:calcineurin-like phosphoesterase family protein
LSEKLKLAIIGDPHVAVPRGDPDPRLEVDPGRKLHGLSVELLTQTVAEVNACRGVEAVLVMGDLTRDSELFNHEVARDILGKLAAPYYIVAGNHDLERRRNNHVTYPDTEHLERQGLVEFYPQAFPGGTTRYVVELPGGVVLVVLDGNRSIRDLALVRGGIRRQDHGWVDQDQCRWLHAMLGNIRQQRRLPLVAVHHSVFDQSPAEKRRHPLRRFFTHWRLHGAVLLKRVLVRHRVPLVLSGHLHAQSVNIEDGVTNLITAATVSYPHAWRLLTVMPDAIHVESHALEGVPSCRELQQQSRRWLGEGMADLVEQHAKNVPLLSDMSAGLRQFIIDTEWWPKFCDGTLAGFNLDENTLPGGAMKSMVYRRIAAILNEYGVWKALRPDPNTLSISLAPRAE